eukprot:scaffold10794_cov66-Phaeocystis_antarctica.AAC.9
MALSSAGAGWPAVAYAHAVLARPWSEYFPSRGAASFAMPWSSAGAAWPDVAYAHASECSPRQVSRGAAHPARLLSTLRGEGALWQARWISPWSAPCRAPWIALECDAVHSPAQCAAQCAAHLLSEAAKPRRRLRGDRVEQRWLSSLDLGKAVRGVGQLLHPHRGHAPRAVRRQPRPQRVACPPARGGAQVGEAVDDDRQPALVEAGQRPLRGQRERLQQRRLRSQRAPLGSLLAHQLA